VYAGTEIIGHFLGNVLIGADKNEGDVDPAGLEGRHRFRPGQMRHEYIANDYVRFQSHRGFDKFVTVGHLANHMKFSFQDPNQANSHFVVIIGN
jgi:hypothetical protein